MNPSAVPVVAEPAETLRGEWQTDGSLVLVPPDGARWKIGRAHV